MSSVRPAAIRADADCTLADAGISVFSEYVATTGHHLRDVLLMSKSDEQLYSTLHRGMQAAVDLTVVKPILEARKNDIIDSAIAKFDSQDPERKMTERDAILVIAALSENARLLRDLTDVEHDGRKAGKKLELNA
jgi:hypothetical protein